MGEFSNPNLYEKFVVKKIIKRLNTQQIFDFDYQAKDGDLLELFSKIDQIDQDENNPDYILVFKNGKWSYMEPFEAHENIHRITTMGEILGPLTSLTKAYKDFLEYANEETLVEFDRNFGYFLKPLQKNILQ
ncbi:hypothetical protein HME7025_01762 [Aquirufa nivalisilvae]|uniref:Uncharacterized protein n=1 Tax=Aquirufa nivalisilvae TaxID=2516557 RepID=A0A2S2DW12_9BACT|nr:hypothetical protein [Aquirufa nivalisilvae]AWL09614.1 hypothetical protein HME7025_01762 [Aquirufa nivalisilvae]